MSSQQEINTSNNSYDDIMTKIKKWGQGEQIVPIIRDIPKEETLIRKALKNPGVLVSSTPEIKGNSRCYVCFFSIKNKVKLHDNRNAIISFSITERDKWAIQDASNYIHNLLSIKSFELDEIINIVDEIERYVIPMKLEIEGASDKEDKKYASKILEMMITVKE